MEDSKAFQELVFGEESYVVSNDTIATNDNVSADASVETKIMNEPPQTEEEMRHCKHCDFRAEDWPTFSKHVFKPGHLRKLAEAYNIRLSTEPLSTTFSCDVCAVECQGHQPWVAHLLGAKHRKALELLSIARATEKNAIASKNKTGGPIKNNQFNNMHNKKPYDRIHKTIPQRSYVPAIAARDFAKYPEPLIGLEYVTEIQVAGQNPRYECCICDTKFDHNLKFPHLVGQKHRTNVLKIKRPESVKGFTQLKRSEITTILIRESTRLEQEEGRSVVQTKTVDPPFSFNADYSQQNTAGRGGTIGGRGKTWNTRGATRVGGAGRGNSGYKSNRGMSKASAGFNVGQSAVPSPSRASGSSSYNYESYHSFSDSYANDPYGMTNSSSFDNTTYRGSYVQSSGQAYSEQIYSGTGSNFSGSASHSYSVPPPQIPYPENREIPPKQQDKTKESISADLASALGDLTKLVQNEEDASVALHVSNALTQALLQYRMGKPETQD